ncbi:MAG: phosphoribosylanthranilate isomerase [Spirochaetaceae bacterium]|nr:MAG: phosphoribosylanthranilate isomerase [Spirochaetaceae bacterium]
MKRQSEVQSFGTASPSRVRIKICGLTRSEDASLALSLGADYLGFIFAKSPRQVSPETAEAIAHALEIAKSADRSIVERVGVFVNAGQGFIESTARQASLTMLQLHGDEDPEFCTHFELPVIKALRIRDRGIFELVDRYSTPYILLEPYVGGRYGGTGVQANWKLAAELVLNFPQRRFFLAGGLGAENVLAAISTVQPFAVDASSALESSPGVKDRQKLKTFIEAVRNG